MKLPVIRPVILTFALLMTIAACSGFSDRPANAIIRITASNELNPDINGRPSPIVLRLYSLRNADSFNNARFFELYENGDDTLGIDLLEEYEFEIFPGDTREMEMSFQLETQFLGFMAAYRDIDQAIWRDSVSVSMNETSTLDVQLGQLSINVIEEERGGLFF